MLKQSYTKTVNGIDAVINTFQLEICFFSPSTVRIRKYPQGNIPSWKSLSVIQQPEKTAFTVREADDELILETDTLVTVLNMNAGVIAFRSVQGITLLKEKAKGAKFTDFDDAGEKTYTVQQSFQLEKHEKIYGLGILQNGKMSQRGTKITMVQKNTYTFIPFFQSSKGYGIFWDNCSPTNFSDSQRETVFKSEVGDCIDYYFMYGGNSDGVTACMRQLTGQAPMFPLWTFGYWQSKERYKSQDETIGVVKKYRDAGIPLDGIIQDWRYWGNNYLWNAMEFLDEGFPEPQKMIDQIHSLKAHMIISVWNSFGPHTKQYRDLEQINALFDFKTWPESGSFLWPPNPDYPSGVRVYDAYNPSARDIYWSYMKRGIFSLGVDGWWIDSSEPDHFDPKPEDFDQQTYLGSFRKVRNAFPLMTVGGVYDHQRETSSDKRVFILTRSAFAGQQRYGANTWSGDIVASWDVLKNQICGGLNFSLCGIPYFNSDIGGFFLWNFKDQLKDPEYRELYARWIQFGAFCPMMRSHGADAPREIFEFGSEGDEIFDAIANYIRLRYSLLPYIYSCSRDVTAEHSSMFRALVMDFASDEKALDINDEYMFGKSILVGPVTQSMYVKNKKADFSTVKSKEIYLPAGSGWYDFWTGEEFAGGRKIRKATPIDIIPLYVRAGSIIPIGPDVQYAQEKKWDALEIRIYEGADGEFSLYEDENDNYNYEKGKFSIIVFSWNDNEKELTIAAPLGRFPGMLKKRVFKIVKIGRKQGKRTDMVENRERLIHYSGKEIKEKIG